MACSDSVKVFKSSESQAVVVDCDESLANIINKYTELAATLDCCEDCEDYPTPSYSFGGTLPPVALFVICADETCT